jgi:hypothetical protein
MTLSNELQYRASLSGASVGNAIIRVTFICVLCTLRTQISRSTCNFTHYSNINNNNNLTINIQLHTPPVAFLVVGGGVVVVVDFAGRGSRANTVGRALRRAAASAADAGWRQR